MFYLASLVPSHGSPEKYTYGTVQTDTDGYASAEDLLHDIISEGNRVFELGVDELPGQAEDIRACLACNPGRVFMSLLFDEPDYFCIVELP
ncbi:hypothetical protein [Dechloromonas denitrificans]|uniref:hypothetical protein n=1 Tax=Dechloromonas denitrificans TaxID=281362 RepID=UPI001CFB6171|nr:hypothetical protein [Dechloromonas denitrificans]UCV09692.1 hypothetical protein KI615_09360 [Dechloromonas denitrificans]